MWSLRQNLHKLSLFSDSNMLSFIARGFAFNSAALTCNGLKMNL